VLLGLGGTEKDVSCIPMAAILTECLKKVRNAKYESQCIQQRNDMIGG
jgi:hypothetical protein